jgi:DNA polymerase (family 10)
VADPSNAAIAAAFDELGDLYELDGAIVHRVLAYRNAAKAVREAPVSVSALAKEGTVTSLPGVGKTLEEKILALVTTGTIPASEKLRAKFPPGLIDLTRLPGLGPKRARKLFDELGIASLEALREAAAAGRLRDVRGFGIKFEETVLAAFEAGIADQPRRRTLLHRALQIGDAIVEELRAHPSAQEVHLAGGARRLTDSVKDLDVVATAKDPAKLAKALGELDLVESSSVAGENAAKAMTHTGMPIDLRVVEPGQLGNLLQHFTGSRAHNVRLRERAVRRGLHVSEYGILDDATGETHRCATEEEVYEKLGLPLIAPELREDRGELDPGFVHPVLVEVGDIRGDLHSHTTRSDGRNSIEQMALAARERGYEYLAVTDHSATHGFGNHVTPDDLRRHVEAIREVDERVEGVRLLAGTETNILPDGSPDYDEELLASLDWVVASVHTAFQTPQDEMTKRIVTALEHPYVDCLGHPTGRLIERREGYTFDLDEVLAAAKRTRTMLEINANPNRRDLRDTHARAAALAGVLIAISSDAHGTDTLKANMRWGVATARRAWLQAADVANTRSWEEFAPLRKRAR